MYRLLRKPGNPCIVSMSAQLSSARHKVFASSVVAVALGQRVLTSLQPFSNYSSVVLTYFLRAVATPVPTTQSLQIPRRQLHLFFSMVILSLKVISSFIFTSGFLMETNLVHHFSDQSVTFGFWGLCQIIEGFRKFGLEKKSQFWVLRKRQKQNKR